MKFFRQLCITIVLALSLSLTAFAGETPCGIVNPPPPGQAAVVLEPAEADGETPCGIADSLTQLAAGLVGSLMAIF